MVIECNIHTKGHMMAKRIGPSDFLNTLQWYVVVSEDAKVPLGVERDFVVIKEVWKRFNAQRTDVPRIFQVQDASERFV